MLKMSVDADLRLSCSWFAIRSKLQPGMSFYTASAWYYTVASDYFYLRTAFTCIPEKEKKIVSSSFI